MAAITVVFITLIIILIIMLPSSSIVGVLCMVHCTVVRTMSQCMAEQTPATKVLVGHFTVCFLHGAHELFPRWLLDSPENSEATRNKTMPSIPNHNPQSLNPSKAQT